MRIPRSLLQENLSTSDYPPLHRPNGDIYHGPIFKTYTGQFFEGATYTNQARQLFFKQGDLLTKTEKNAGYENEIRETRYLYNISNNNAYIISKKQLRSNTKDLYINRTIVIPEKTYKNPTIENYFTGSYLRFICKSRYNNSYFFTTLKSYKDYKKNQNATNVKYLSMFAMAGIPWFIRANSREDVIKINQYYIGKLKENRKFQDIERFITKYDQFYRNKNQYLNTRGNELVYSNGLDYKGLYHIHPDKGPMEGPVHKSTPHQQLYLKNTKVSMEEGINNLAFVKTLNTLLKFLTINNISKEKTISTKQLDNIYQSQEQKQQELLISNTATYSIPNTNNQNTSTGGGY